MTHFSNFDDELSSKFTAAWDDIEDSFFSRGSTLEKGSQLHKDFLIFFTKFLKFKSSKAKAPEKKNTSPENNFVVNGITFPAYKPQHKVNCVALPDSNQHMSSILKEFQEIASMYIQFHSKKSIAKLAKLMNDRSSLPIAAYEAQIVELLRTNAVIIVAGDTGCGKSTQVPQYLLKAGYRKIACTQPRRISAISLARRVSYETLNQYGSQVAHQIRFENTQTADTRILFLTEGLLLRQLGADPLLSRYDIIILDEVHERHISMDFLLGLLLLLLRRRTDLKVVLMSATVNAELFSDYFKGAPVLRVPGRCYPVQVQSLAWSSRQYFIHSSMIICVFKKKLVS